MLADVLYLGTPNSNPNVVKGYINKGNYMCGEVLFLELEFELRVQAEIHVLML